MRAVDGVNESRGAGEAAVEPATPTPSSGGPGPGAGVAVAALALLVGMLLAWWYRRE